VSFTVIGWDRTASAQGQEIVAHETSYNAYQSCITKSRTNLSGSQAFIDAGEGVFSGDVIASPANAGRSDLSAWKRRLPSRGTRDSAPRN